MEEKHLTYEEAYNELQNIIQRMESGDMKVDELQENIKRSAELIKICKDTLTKIEIDVNKLIEDIENGAEG